MEFSVFIQGYLPGPQAHDPDREHEGLLQRDGAGGLC